MFYSVFANPAIDMDAIFDEINENDLEIYNLLPSLISSIKDLKRNYLKAKHINGKVKQNIIHILNLFCEKLLCLQKESTFKKQLLDLFCQKSLDPQFKENSILKKQLLKLKEDEDGEFINIIKNKYIFYNKYLLDINNKFEKYDNDIIKLNFRNTTNEIFSEIKNIINLNFEKLKLINKKLQVPDSFFSTLKDEQFNAHKFLGNNMLPMLEENLEKEKIFSKNLKQELIEKENLLKNAQQELNEMHNKSNKIQNKLKKLTEEKNVLLSKKEILEDKKIIIENNNTIEFDANANDSNDDNQIIEDENYEEKWWLQFENKKNKKHTDLKSVYLQENKNNNEEISVVHQILGTYLKKTKIHQDNLLERIIAPGKNKIKELNWASHVIPLIEELGGSVQKSSKGFIVKLNTIKTFFHTHGKIYKDTINDHLRNFLISALS